MPEPIRPEERVMHELELERVEAKLAKLSRARERLIVGKLEDLVKEAGEQGQLKGLLKFRGFSENFEEEDIERDSYLRDLAEIRLESGEGEEAAEFVALSKELTAAEGRKKNLASRLETDPTPAGERVAARLVATERSAIEKDVTVAESKTRHYHHEVAEKNAGTWAKISKNDFGIQGAEKEFDWSKDLESVSEIEAEADEEPLSLDIRREIAAGRIISEKVARAKDNKAHFGRLKSEADEAADHATERVKSLPPEEVEKEVTAAQRKLAGTRKIIEKIGDKNSQDVISEYQTELRAVTEEIAAGGGEYSEGRLRKIASFKLREIKRQIDMAVALRDSYGVKDKKVKSAMNLDIEKLRAAQFDPNKPADWQKFTDKFAEQEAWKRLFKNYMDPIEWENMVRDNGDKAARARGYKPSDDPAKKAAWQEAVTILGEDEAFKRVQGDYSGWQMVSITKQHMDSRAMSAEELEAPVEISRRVKQLIRDKKEAWDDLDRDKQNAERKRIESEKGISNESGKKKKGEGTPKSIVDEWAKEQAHKELEADPEFVKLKVASRRLIGHFVSDSEKSDELIWTNFLESAEVKAVLKKHHLDLANEEHKRTFSEMLATDGIRSQPAYWESLARLGELTGKAAGLRKKIDQLAPFVRKEKSAAAPADEPVEVRRPIERKAEIDYFHSSTEQMRKVLGLRADMSKMIESKIAELAKGGSEKARIEVALAAKIEELEADGLNLTRPGEPDFAGGMKASLEHDLYHRRATELLSAKDYSPYSLKKREQAEAESNEKIWLKKMAERAPDAAALFTEGEHGIETRMKRIDNPAALDGLAGSGAIIGEKICSRNAEWWDEKSKMHPFGSADAVAAVQMSERYRELAEFYAAHRAALSPDFAGRKGGSDTFVEDKLLPLLDEAEDPLFEAALAKGREALGHVRGSIDSPVSFGDLGRAIGTIDDTLRDFISRADDPLLKKFGGPKPSLSKLETGQRMTYEGLYENSLLGRKIVDYNKVVDSLSEKEIETRAMKLALEEGSSRLARFKSEAIEQLSREREKQIAEDIFAILGT